MRTILLPSVTSAPTSSAVATHQHDNTYNRTFQASVVGTGAVTATVLIEVSNDNVNFLTLGTITLSGTTSHSDGFASSAAWDFVRATVSAISGTGAAVNVVMGY